MEQTEQTAEVLPEELQLNDGTEALPTDNPQPTAETMTADGEPQQVGAFGIESDIYTEAEFVDGFRGVFNASGDITGIQALKINMDDTRERVGSERAAVRLYAACTKYNWLHFMIDKRSGWFADIVIIGSFAVAKGKAVAEEVGYSPKMKLFDKVKKWLKIGKKEQVAAA